jgi:hypothetical protein
VRARAAVLLALLAATCASVARATTIPGRLVQVKVSLRAKTMALSDTSAPRGFTVEFGVRNTTAAARTFSLAGKRILVPARKLRYFGVEFDRRGRYPVVSRGGGTTVRKTFRVS